jgi:hypothetical protein
VKFVTITKDERLCGICAAGFMMIGQGDEIGNQWYDSPIALKSMKGFYFHAFERHY